ncbi:MAG: hypothetical protein ABFC88_13435 [Thermoguttaceae bacterium]
MTNATIEPKPELMATDESGKTRVFPTVLDAMRAGFNISVVNQSIRRGTKYRGMTWQRLDRSYQKYADRLPAVPSCSSEEELHKLIVTSWAELASPSTTFSAIEFIRKYPGRCPTLESLVHELGSNLETALGTLLRHFEDRPVNGKKIIHTTEKRTPHWFVVRA